MADGKITIDTEINQKGAEKGTQNLQKKLDGTAKKAKTVGGNMTKYLTAPLLAIGGMGFAAADSMDKAFGKIQTATGATGEELDNLKQDFEEVFTEVPDSADQVADALGNLNTLTGATGEDLQGLTENVLDAARSLDEDGVAASEAFGKAMGQWQVPAEDGQDKLDGLFKLTQDYGVGLQEISSHLTEYGSVLQNAGFSMDESADLMSRLEGSGLSVSRVMPGLNQAFRNWASEGKDSREELEKTMEAMKEAESDQESLKIATEAFGAEGAQRMKTAIENDTLPALDDLSEGMDKAKGAVEENNEQTETFGEKMGELKNKATVGLAPLGDILIDLAENALPPVVSAIESVAEWFGNLSPVTQKIIIGIGALIAVLGPLLVMFGMLVPAITAVSLPILGIVAAVVAVIAIIATLTTLIVVYWDEIKEYTMIAWNAIKEFFKATWDWIKEVFSITIEWIKNAASTAWDWIKETTMTVWNAIKDFFSSLWEGIKNTFNTVIEGIKTAVQSAWDWIKNTTSSVWNGIKSFITGLWNGIKSAATSAFNFIKDSISNVWNAVKSVTSSVWNGIKSTVTGIWDGLKSSVSNIFNSIKDTISDVWNSIKDTTSDIWDGIVDTIKGAINGVIDAINGMLNSISDIGISLPELPGWVPGDMGGGSISFPSIPNIPKLDVGTNFVAQDGLAMLHQGEAVVPKEYNPAADGGKGQKQPAIIQLRLGNNNFRKFVEDITNVQDEEEAELEAFRG